MIALLLNPRSPIITENERRSVEITAAALGRKIQILYASSESEIEAAFATTARQGTGGLQVSGDAFFTNRRNQIVGGRGLARPMAVDLAALQAFLISIFCCFFASSAGFGRWMCNTPLSNFASTVAGSGSNGRGIARLNAP
jgi:hypothetical protein